MKKHLLKSDYRPLILMILLIIILLLSFMFSPAAFGQTFQKAYGGTNLEMAWSFQSTDDGGYIMTGSSSSYFGLSGTHLYVVKTNAAGDTLWTRAYTGTGAGFSVKQTSDGGYILSGGTYLFSTGGQDGYVIKTDNLGNVVWSKTYGGPNNDDIMNVQPTTDGGYMLFGSTSSFGAGSFDIYMIKTDNMGDTIWTKTYGGPGEEGVWQARQTYDSGYIIVGQTDSYSAGQTDAMLMKTDKHGNLMWTKTYGGVEADGGYSVMQTSDSGYIMSGKTHSYGAFANDGDLYLVRTDKYGDTLWTKAYGGAGTDVGRSVIQTADGNFIVTGHSWSFGGENSIYLVRTDANGSLLWSRTYGGALMDDAVGIVRTADGGYAVGGFTENFGSGVVDYIVIRTDSGGHAGCSEDSPFTVQTPCATVTSAPTMAPGRTNSAVASFAVFSTHGGVMTPVCAPAALMAEDVAATAPQVYSNPASESVTITFGGLTEGTVSILNIVGEQVFERTIAAGTSSVEVGVRGFAPGVYFVRVLGVEGQYIRKLIIK